MPHALDQCHGQGDECSDCEIAPGETDAKRPRSSSPDADAMAEVIARAAALRLRDAEGPPKRRRLLSPTAPQCAPPAAGGAQQCGCPAAAGDPRCRRRACGAAAEQPTAASLLSPARSLPRSTAASAGTAAEDAVQDACGSEGSDPETPPAPRAADRPSSGHKRGRQPPACFASPSARPKVARVR
eukprot:TRINITY_DN13236_c0_g1_i1.p2 TRINITY_DN13236_c0_g1~~TRINITY_DN13236_c0_g1_i1.p2  ORF type:complete len:185 (+),score=44.76 TRINITY_DN13236_c0_g1_i1:73-627(+)